MRAERQEACEGPTARRVAFPRGTPGFSPAVDWRPEQLPAGALVEYARRRFAASWFDSGWSPANLAEAVLEALVVPTRTPRPRSTGIEIAAVEARQVDHG